MEQDRRHKSNWTRIVEVLTVLSALGIGTLIFQVGGYKEKIDSLCEQFNVYSEKNDRDHAVITTRLNTTQQALVAATGKTID